MAQAFELHLSSNDCEQLICDQSSLCHAHPSQVNAVCTASHIIRQLPFKISATQKIDYDRKIHFKPYRLGKYDLMKLLIRKTEKLHFLGYVV